ncbi:unnamed protein product, partial [Symbiodinium sp. CCMP2592]
MPREDGAAQADADGMKDMSQKMPTLGNRIMVLKEGWVALILSGTKTMELRNQPAKTGPIWIGFEGRVYAHAEISDCRQMSQEIYEETRAQHRHMGKMKQGDSLYGLVLTNLVQLAHPIDYYQKPATVLWENFRTGPDEKLPPRRASKRAQEMRALQDAREDDETSEIDESPGCKNTEEEDRRGKDGGDATRPSTERQGASTKRRRPRKSALPPIYLVQEPSPPSTAEKAVQREDGQQGVQDTENATTDADSDCSTKARTAAVPAAQATPPE